jgi:hypothetical protein
LEELEVGLAFWLRRMLLLLLLLVPSPLSASLNTLSLSRSLMTLEPRSVVLRFVEDEQDRL